MTDSANANTAVAFCHRDGPCLCVGEPESELEICPCWRADAPTEPEALRRHRLQRDVEREFAGSRALALSVVELAESAVALDRFVALLRKHGFA